jgi:hypothetical protein
MMEPPPTAPDAPGVGGSQLRACVGRALLAQQDTEVAPREVCTAVVDCLRAGSLALNAGLAWS